jgi:ATP-dependent DNA ligase
VTWQLLWKLLSRRAQPVLYVDRVESGSGLFRVICERDMEGVVAKQASDRPTPDATTWVKIKNRRYSQAIGREDFFDHGKAKMTLAEGTKGHSGLQVWRRLSDIRLRLAQCVKKLKPHLTRRLGRNRARPLPCQGSGGVDSVAPSSVAS